MHPDSAAIRPGADRCPGALVLHEAADGGLARVRLPGGFVDGPVLVALTELAERLGTGGLELTSRGNAQLRGIAPGDRADLAAGVAALGLLPSATHERVRNIVASPLAGLDAGAGDGVDPVVGAGLPALVRALDDALCADPALAALSGRFLFGFDDGHGDIAALAPDAWATPARSGRWWVAPPGVEVAADEVLDALLAVARAFLAVAGLPEAAGDGPSGAAVAADGSGHAVRPARPAGPAWRIRDLADGGTDLGRRLRQGRPVAPCPVVASGHHHVGPSRRPDGGWAGTAQVPLGWLTRPAAEALASAAGDSAGAAAPDAAAGAALRITPWRGVVVPALADPTAFELAAGRAGLVTTVGSPWTRVTACAGRPGCASALADVRADARRAVAAGRTTPAARPSRTGHLPPAGRAASASAYASASSAAASASASLPSPAPVHWSGCSRRCGRPAGAHVDVVAGPAGYEVREVA